MPPGLLYASRESQALGYEDRESGRESLISPSSGGPRIAVLGAGAVGCYITALLQRSGLPCTVVGRRPIAEQIRQKGLTLRSREIEFVVHPDVRVAGKERGGDFGVVILAVKAYSVERALVDVEGLLDADGLVIALQNGVGSDQILVEALGPSNVVAASSTVAVKREGSVIYQQSSKGGLAWAAFSRESLQDVVVPTLLATGLQVKAIDSIASLRWSKLLLNALGASQSAILQEDIAFIASSPELFEVERMAHRETISVMRSGGIRLADLPGYPVRIASLLMTLPAALSRHLIGDRMRSARGSRRPGLAQDVERGGPTENHYLNGATVRLGKELGIPTPVNRTLTRLVDEVTASKDARAHFRQNPEALLREVRQGQGPEV